MDNKKRSPSDRLLFATFLKGRISSRDVWEEKQTFDCLLEMAEKFAAKLE